MAMVAEPASTTMISFVKSRRPVCLTIIAYVLPIKDNIALIMRTESNIKEKFSVKFAGTAKLKRRRKARITETAQRTKSMLKIIHEGVVDRKNFTDLTRNEFEFKIGMGTLFSWSIILTF